MLTTRKALDSWTGCWAVTCWTHHPPVAHQLFLWSHSESLAAPQVFQNIHITVHAFLSTWKALWFGKLQDAAQMHSKWSPLTPQTEWEAGHLIHQALCSHLSWHTELFIYFSGICELHSDLFVSESPIPGKGPTLSEFNRFSFNKCPKLKLSSLLVCFFFFLVLNLTELLLPEPKEESQALLTLSFLSHL